jgi:putative zinc finger/helix-turn-helix YgiT family protein
MAAHSTRLAKSSQGRRASSTSISRRTKPTPSPKAARATPQADLFAYPCPECGRGGVHTTRIRNYRTKVKGYPFVVEEALVGVCGHCQAESFAPEETQRWEAAFYQTLDARQAFLSPAEITALRTDMGLSMEEFARLLGCTRQSVCAWEHPERATPPSRMADLLLRLLRRSWAEGTVDVLHILLEEVQKWGVIIEVRQRTPQARDGKRALAR